MPIPDHAGFLAYAPSFTLDVPAGNMPDLNGQEHLERLDRCFELALGVMRERLAVSAP
jgi:histone deacetylase 8